MKNALCVSYVAFYFFRDDLINFFNDIYNICYICVDNIKDFKLNILVLNIIVSRKLVQVVVWAKLLFFFVVTIFVKFNIIIFQF